MSPCPVFWILFPDTQYVELDDDGPPCNGH
jgi:hypothetical protein